MKRRPFNHYSAPSSHEDSPRFLIVGLIVAVVLSSLLAVLMEHAR